MPIATAVVRLSDVAPDGTVAQVSAGILNLTHRHGHELPEALVPGQVEEVALELRSVGYRFAAGHRLRLSLATAWWPVIWPSPLAGELSVRIGRSRLVLPEVPADPGCQPLRFGPSRPA